VRHLQLVVGTSEIVRDSAGFAAPATFSVSSIFRRRWARETCNGAGLDGEVRSSTAVRPVAFAKRITLDNGGHVRTFALRDFGSLTRCLVLDVPIDASGTISRTRSNTHSPLRALPVKVSIEFAHLLNRRVLIQPSSGNDQTRVMAKRAVVMRLTFLRYWQSPLRAENESVFTAVAVKVRQVRSP